MKQSVAFYILVIIFIFLAIACSTTRIVREFHDPIKLNSSQIHNKSIKLHMTDGCLYLLDSLKSGGNIDSVSGYGSYFNQYRELIKTNKSSTGYYFGPPFKIPMSGVALFETNDATGLRGKVVALTLIGVPTLLVSIYCIINPKACFGSCPTFYAWDGQDMSLMAEGFSSSILRSLEKRDIDMLYRAKSTGSTFNLRLTNEALETHVIKYADLLVVPRSDCERVFATEEGRFFRVSDVRSPSSCKGPEGECLDKVEDMDNNERFSEADQKNLIQKEYVDLEFKSVSDGKTGLIIGSRQTFMTTYLFYQSLAYLGNSAGNFAAMIESGDSSLRKHVNKIWDLLGGIQVSVANAKGKWIKAGEIKEMGPIASDVHLIKLPETGTKTVKIRLELTKGLWRIDWLALARLDQPVEPIKISPSQVIPENKNNTYGSVLQLRDTLEPLVTLPGDSYKLVYELPSSSKQYEFFLSSKGYYIEWMRESWIEEENHRKAALLFGFPRIFMRMAAADFKKLEPAMEEMFWKSRYVKKD